MMAEESKPRVCNPGDRSFDTSKSYPTSVIKLTPETRHLKDGVEQGRITSFNISGWCKHYWLLPEPQKHSLWIELSKHIDHTDLIEFQSHVKAFEVDAMGNMVARRTSRRRVRR
jgi:hypothetical protein